MKGFVRIVLVAVLVLLLAFPAAAASSASQVESFLTVAADGSCQVTTTVTLHLEQTQGDLSFPIPAGAANVTLNGSRAKTTAGGDRLYVDLSKAYGGVTGDISFTLNYTVYGLVEENSEGILELRLPLMSGFALPVDTMSFSITLPGEIPGSPAFTSGYYQASIEKYLTYTKEGAMIKGSTTQSLKDHETLLMTLGVSDQMFPQVSRPVQRTYLDDLVIGVCAALALAYWLIFLRCPIPWKKHSTCPPQGYSAGQAGTVLFLKPCDLTTMILSWAQLGYLHLRYSLDRVVVTKQMDMGNERSGFERKWFRKLFSRGDTVSTASNFYVQLAQAVEAPGVSGGELRKGRRGSLRIFRALLALLGVGMGINIAIPLASGGVLQWLWVAVFGLAGGIAAWKMIPWLSHFFLRTPGQGWLCLAAAGVLAALGAFAGEALSVSLGVLGILLGGVLYAWGGRRTEAGLLLREEILGLRSYLRKGEVRGTASDLRQDPDCFFNLLPWALALGVDKAFARNMGGRKLPDCPYVILDRQLSYSPDQWCRFFRQLAKDMERRKVQQSRSFVWELLSSLTGKPKKRRR